jgi:hypothetical protein
MKHDPCASNRRVPKTSDHFEVDRIASSMLVSGAGDRVTLPRGLTGSIAKEFRVRGGERELGEKHAGLVTASYVGSAQAVVAQLGDIDYGPFASGKVHSKERIRGQPRSSQVNYFAP